MAPSTTVGAFYNSGSFLWLVSRWVRASRTCLRATISRQGGVPNGCTLSAPLQAACHHASFAYKALPIAAMQLSPMFNMATANDVRRKKRALQEDGVCKTKRVRRTPGAALRQ